MITIRQRHRRTERQTDRQLNVTIPRSATLRTVKTLSRHEAVIRIGHTRLTHSYLLSGDEPPTCSSCGLALTVHHILLDCPDLYNVRQRYFSVSSLKDLFENTYNNYSIDSIKETQFLPRNAL